MICQFFLDTAEAIQKETRKALDATFEILGEPPTDYYCPDIPNNHLVMIEHKGIQFVAKVHHYEMGNAIHGKICYLNETHGRPAVMLNKKNFKYLIGDVREFVAKHSEPLLEIAKFTRTRSVITLINVFKMLKEKRKLEPKEVKEAHKIYKHRLQMMEYSWSG